MLSYKYKIVVTNDNLHHFTSEIDEIMCEIDFERYLFINKYAIFASDDRSIRGIKREDMIPIKLDVDENTIKRLYSLAKFKNEAENTIKHFSEKITDHVFNNKPYVTENMMTFKEVGAAMFNNHILRYPKDGGSRCEYCGKKLHYEPKTYNENTFDGIILTLPMCKTCYNISRGNPKYDIIGKNIKDAINHLDELGVSWTIVNSINDFYTKEESEIGIVIEKNIVRFYGDRYEQ